MKKIILTAIIVLACAVHAQTYPIGSEWQSSGGRKNEKVDVLYHADNGSVQFNYSWGGPDPNPNQMWRYERTDKNTGWKYEGGTFEFTADYVWTDFDTRLDERAGTPGTIIEYGYYTIGADGQVGDPIALWSKDAAGQTIENSVVFQRGEKIGVYLTIDENTGTPVTFTSVADAIEGAASTSPNVDTHSRGEDKQYFCLFDNRDGKEGINNVSHYEYHMGGLLASTPGQSYEDFIEQVIAPEGGKTNITDSTGNPVSGQPLPGTLATLLIGSLCAGSLRKRNKK